MSGKNRKKHSKAQTQNQAPAKRRRRLDGKTAAVIGGGAAAIAAILLGVIFSAHACSSLPGIPADGSGDGNTEDPSSVPPIDPEESKGETEPADPVTGPSGGGDGTDRTDGTGEPDTEPVTEKKTPAVPDETVVIIDFGDLTAGEPDEDPAGTEKYDCGYPNHACDGPETHAFTLNLELAGCPYCGSHSCRSFYAKDRWGNTSYDPTFCPQYSELRDPAEYCADCGRECGNGWNGTCTKFIRSGECPLCGEHVEAGICHSCN